jgi:predicted ArsR family transcriptional regulator
MEIECLTPTQIANKLRTSYVATRTHLKTLENNDVLTHVRFGKRICHYRFKENARANAVRQLIETWKDYENQT